MTEITVFYDVVNGFHVLPNVDLRHLNHSFHVLWGIFRYNSKIYCTVFKNRYPAPVQCIKFVRHTTPRVVSAVSGFRAKHSKKSEMRKNINLFSIVADRIGIRLFKSAGSGSG
jgi:hypothetical protein